MGNTASNPQTLWPSALPDKNTYAYVKENEYDDFSVWGSDDLPFSPIRIDTNELLDASTENLKFIGDKILAGLKKDSFVILKATPDHYQKILQMRKESKFFLSQSEDDKKSSGAPEMVDGVRGYYSGYSPLYFDNRNNRRDKEWRDVFQLRLSEEGHIPWPSESFQQAAVSHYLAQWLLCMEVLRALAHSFAVSESSLLELLTTPHAQESNGPSPSTSPVPAHSENTNLCLFRYYDKMRSYTAPQKCMVHQDNGILTLLPKTDYAGLEILHPEIQQWISLEKYIQDDEILLYTGISLSKVCMSAFPAATHRVVRHPAVERFSMPFELKPNKQAPLKPIFSPNTYTEQAPYQTFENMEKDIAWKKLQRTVMRSDGIEPGTEEEKRNLEAAAATSSSCAFPPAVRCEESNPHAALEAC